MNSAEKYLMKLRNLKMTDSAVFLYDSGTIDVYGNGDADGFLFDVMKKLGTPVLFFGRPSEPFFTILNTVASHGDFSPNDSETRTFLHTIPVLDSADASAAADSLRRRKAVWIKNHGILTSAPYGAEQAYVYFCSVIFSGFVKFFTDAGDKAAANERFDRSLVRLMFEKYLHFIPIMHKPALMSDIFLSRRSITTAMSEAGRASVNMGLVDSFFGNVSAYHDGNIYISRTGSSLDELDSEIDICPMDESRCTGLTASSELASHRRIYEMTDSRVILHAHPRFSVIMSMMCQEVCSGRGRCHYSCEAERFLRSVPIVAGEVGNGPRAMVNTMPPAVKSHKSAIVYGHGIFTVSAKDFNEAFARLIQTESDALTLYHHLAC